MVEIIINDMQKIVALDDCFKNNLEEIATECLKQGKAIHGEAGITFVDDEFIADLNKNYRGLHGPTDVLAFPLNEEDMIGDVIVSVERANIQAKEQGHSLYYEIAFLVAHGALHLAGFDHKTDDTERDMLARAESILNNYRV